MSGTDEQMNAICNTDGWGWGWGLQSSAVIEGAEGRSFKQTLQLLSMLCAPTLRNAISMSRWTDVRRLQRFRMVL